MFNTQKKIADLSEKIELYQNCAASWASSDKPYEQGLCLLFTKAAEATQVQAGQLEKMNNLAGYILYVLLTEVAVSVKQAEVALRLQEEIERLDAAIANPSPSELQWWLWKEPIPTPEEQKNIIVRARNYATMDRERVGLKAMLDAQKIYLVCDGIERFPSRYIDERTFAGALVDAKGVKKKAETELDAITKRAGTVLISFVMAFGVAALAAILLVNAPGAGSPPNEGKPTFENLNRAPILR